MKSMTTNREAAADKGRLFTIMNTIAWIVLCAGLLLCLFNLNEFTDKNLGLMVGVGCLIASVQIYVIGTVVNLLQNSIKQRNEP